MTTQSAPAPAPEAPRSLFLVELRAATGTPTDLHRMQHDLASTTTRLAARGVDVVLVDSVLLPEDGRCLCLVLGADRSSVALACDTAGLTSAPVHEAHRCSTTTFDYQAPPRQENTP